MKNVLTSVFCLLLLTAAGFPADGIAAPSRKPLPPLRISIVPAQPGLVPGQIKPGDVVELTVTASSSIDVQAMTISVQLLGGAKLVSGDTSWTGPAARNEGKSITLTVQAPEQGTGRVAARVSLPSSAGTRFSAEAHYVLGAEAESTPELKHPVKKDSTGRNIIEYR